MKIFTKSVAISTHPRQVWQVMAQLERWSEWTPSILAITPLGNPPLGPSSQVLIKQPRLPASVWTITVWQPDHRLEWVTHSPGVLISANHLITEHADGCTVTLELIFDGLFSAIPAWLGRGLIEKYLQQEAHGLKRRSERAASSTPQQGV